MRAPPNSSSSSSRVLVLLLLAGIAGIIKPVQALCTCAERFASSKDFTNDTNTPFFDDIEGRTIIFRSAAFHCETTVTAVKYSGQIKNCGDTHCTIDSSTAVENSYPKLRLWRTNESYYYMVETEELREEFSIKVNWSVKPNDIIGLEIPSSCGCTNNILKIGYTYGGGGSRVYEIDEAVEPFRPDDYTLKDGPLPMISVETSDNYNIVCIIGLPAGGFIALIAMCFTCAGVCWSISVYNNAIARKGRFDINGSSPAEQEGTELNEIPSHASNARLPTQTSMVQNGENSERPIYTMPLPPIPTSNIDDVELETRSATSSPRPSNAGFSRQTSFPSPLQQNPIPHAMSNPDLTSTGPRYGNIDHSRMSFRSYTSEGERQNKPPIPQPRLSRQDTNPHLPEPPSTPPPPSDAPLPDFNPIDLSRAGSLEPQETEKQQIEQSYDRNSEYEISDEDSVGEVQDEYMNIGSTTINTSGSDEVYY